MNQLNYHDSNYKSAVNFMQSLYNDPITVNINGSLFILPFGTSDTISDKVDGDYIYFVGENRGLDYISLLIIDTTDNSTQEVYLTGDDINNPENFSFGLLDMDIDQQIKIMSEYIQS